MLLREVTIQNLRCHENLTNIPMHRLTVFIGENDAGKTVLLDGLEMLFTNKLPTPEDYRQLDNEHRADKIVIEGKFEIEAHDTIPIEWRSPDKSVLRLKKTYTSGTSTCEVEGLGFADRRFGSFGKENAATQKEMLTNIGIQPEGSEKDRIAQVQQAIAEGKVPKVPSVIQINFGQLLEHLPRFQYTASAEYKQPDSMIQRTLQTVVDTCLRPLNPTTGEHELLPELSQVKVKIHQALNAKVSEVVDILRRVNPKIKDVQVSPTIDFSRSVTTPSLMLDLGQGFHFVNSFGEGTKKKLWIGLLDWEQEIQRESGAVAAFRVYDEPDVNLDYSAERKLFANIVDLIDTPDSRAQAVICTHAVSLIDRAPAKSINLISVSESGKRKIEYLASGDDSAVQEFLSTMGRAVGVTNSALFYERAFLVVEGESEENALPILYRNIHGHSLIEDGIVLINLHSCGAWNSILSVLQRNKADITIMLLDQDCTDASSSAHVTPEVLAEIGYPPKFLKSNCIFVGSKEFEDAFATNDIIAMLNVHWPKENGTPWVESDVDQFRGPGMKFSESLKDHVRMNCKKVLRSTVHKPDLAERLARQCVSEMQVPQSIRDAFLSVRARSGCGDSSTQLAANVVKEAV